MTADPDSFIREHGADATRGLIDDAVPLRASMLADILARGECPDARLLSARTLTERDLLTAAAGILAIVARLRAGESLEVADRSADLQRAVIALAIRGHVAPAKLGGIPDDAFTGAARLFAWACTCKALRWLGRDLQRSRVSGLGVHVHAAEGRPFDVVRYVLASAPRFTTPEKPFTKQDIADFRAVHGVEATEALLLDFCSAMSATAELWRETYDEIDSAEALPPPKPDVVSRLLAAHRARLASAWLTPVLAALDRGEPMQDTAKRLRDAANIFEGRTTPTRQEDDR